MNENDNYFMLWGIEWLNQCYRMYKLCEEWYDLCFYFWKEKEED